MWMIFFLKFHETHTIWLNSHPACILNFYNLRFYFWNICVSTNLTQTIKCFISRIYFSRLLFTLFGELKAGWSFNVRLNNSFNIDSFHLALVVSVVKSFLDPVLTWACLGSPGDDVRSWHRRAVKVWTIFGDSLLSTKGQCTQCCNVLKYEKIPHLKFFLQLVL